MGKGECFHRGLARRVDEADMAGPGLVDREPNLRLLSSVLQEVRWLRGEQPGRKSFWDAQEACLVDLIRRAVGAASEAEVVPGLVRQALEELVAGTIIKEELLYLIRHKRWKDDTPQEETLVQMRFWDWPKPNFMGEGKPTATTESASHFTTAIADDSSAEGLPYPVPALLAAIGEQPDTNMDDKTCLRWLGELAEGKRGFKLAGQGVPGHVLEGIHGRLGILWHLLQR